MKQIIRILFFLGVVYGTPCVGQTFYLYNKDYCEVQRPMFFLDDAIHQRYVFGVFSICSDSSSRCRLFSTDYSGVILDSFSYSALFDSSLVLQEVLRVDTDGYLLLGFRKPIVWGNYNSGSPVIVQFDTHLSPLLEKSIAFPDTLGLWRVSICRTNHSSFVIAATITKRTVPMISYGPGILYEVSFTGDSLKQKIFSGTNQSGSLFSIIPRYDSAGYWVTSDYFSNNYPNGYLYLDTNFNYKHGLPYYYNGSMFCYCGHFPNYLEQLTPSSFIESRIDGYDSVQTHYIIKHSNTGDYISKKNMPSTNDSLDVGQYAYYNKPMTTPISGNFYVLNNTHMKDGLESFPNFIEVNKCDTSLAILWTKFIGGDRTYNPYYIYSIHNGVMILASYNNQSSAFGWQGENIYFFSIDSLGTVNSINSPPYHEEPLVDIYPNPSTGHFSCLVEDRLKNSTLHIFNSYGQWVYSKLLKHNEEVLDLDHMANGTYWFTISSHDKTLNGGKIIIDHP